MEQVISTLLCPAGTDQNQLVSSSSKQIPTGFKWFQLESTQNQLEYGQNCLEPTGSDNELGIRLGSNLRIPCSYDFHELRLCTYALIDRQRDRSAPQHSHTHPSGCCIVPRHCTHIAHIYKLLSISTAFPPCSVASNQSP